MNHGTGMSEYSREEFDENVNGRAGVEDILRQFKEEGVSFRYFGKIRDTIMAVHAHGAVRQAREGNLFSVT